MKPLGSERLPESTEQHVDGNPCVIALAVAALDVIHAGSCTLPKVRSADGSAVTKLMRPPMPSTPKRVPTRSAQDLDAREIAGIEVGQRLARSPLRGRPERHAVDCYAHDRITEARGRDAANRGRPRSAAMEAAGALLQAGHTGVVILNAQLILGDESFGVDSRPPGTGTSCRFSARFCAVTTISSVVPWSC